MTARNSLNSFMVIASLIVLLSWAPAAHADGRDRMSLDSNWLFSLGGHDGAASTSFDDSGWRQLNLPHDWSIEGTYDENNPAGVAGGFLPTGTGWYRKHLERQPGRHVTSGKLFSKK